MSGTQDIKARLLDITASQVNEADIQKAQEHEKAITMLESPHTFVSKWLESKEINRENK